MPDHETHCLHSLKRYGVRGDEIHSWIDEPSQFFAGSHRQFRHDFETINEAVKVFGIKYGDEMVRNIVLDHWKLDSEGNQNKMMTLVCDRCGANLDSSLKCEHCGLQHIKSDYIGEKYLGISFEEFEEVCENVDGRWKIYETFKNGKETDIWCDRMAHYFPKEYKAWKKRLEVKQLEQILKEENNYIGKMIFL